MSLENFKRSIFARALIMREQEGDAPAVAEMLRYRLDYCS